MVIPVKEGHQVGGDLHVGGRGELDRVSGLEQRATVNIPGSVTRFGKISPLWQIFDSLFLIWQKAEPTLANLLHYWGNFQCYKWQNIEK